MVGLMAGALGVWHFTTGYVRDRMRGYAMRREFWTLAPTEYMGILDDLGLSQREFDAATRLPFASEDLYAMALRSIGVDQDAFHRRYGAWNRSTQRTCMMCTHRRRCRSSLLSGAFAAGHHGFCPNSENFADMISDPEASLYLNTAVLAA